MSDPTQNPKPKRKDNRKGDRHRPGYWAEYLRKRRAALKLAAGGPKP